MHRITLVCSVHRENGLCNAGELLKILLAIAPEVIFEEIRPSDFDFYCKDAARSMLEARAIEMYSEFNSFRRVPVDRFDLPRNLVAEFRRNIDLVFDHVERSSREYQQLTDENDESVHQRGFGYLNGDDFVRVRTRLSEIEDKEIHETGDERLIHWMHRWRRFTQSREHEMVRGIYEFCRTSSFDSGVFLVGAAHKVGIHREIERCSGEEAVQIDWKLRP